MKFEIPKGIFPWKSGEQTIGIKLSNPQEIEYNQKNLLYVKIRFYGVSTPAILLEDASNPVYDPRKTYRLVPGYRISEWTRTKDAMITEVEPVEARDRKDISDLLLSRSVIKREGELIFWE
jgi:hypothetical protein